MKVVAGAIYYGASMKQKSAICTVQHTSHIVLHLYANVCQ